jgi:hypothetical protein
LNGCLLRLIAQYIHKRTLAHIVRNPSIIDHAEQFSMGQNGLVNAT